MQNLLDAVEESGNVQRKELLEEIQQSSRTLAAELLRFIDLCPGFKIYSFYEMDQTRQLVVVRSSRETSTTPHKLTRSFRDRPTHGGETNRLLRQLKTHQHSSNSPMR